MAIAKSFGKQAITQTTRESDRLAALGAFDLLDTPRDDGLERVVHLIRQIFDIEIGIVSLIDAHRQWYKACSGLPFPEVPRADSFCRHVVDAEEAMIVTDTTKDERFARHPAVTGDPHIRFYAGVPLRTGGGQTIGTVCAVGRRVRSFDRRELSILQELAGVAMDRIELLQTASTDSLTQALTRRAFRQEAEQMIALALRHGHHLSCIVLDIDHFKAVNDVHGHAAGDAVLKAVTSVCRTTLRTTDVFGRLGGEEFAVILPHVDGDGAVVTAERLRAAITALTVRNGHNTLAVTSSFGIATLSGACRDLDTLLAQADAAMYQAKQQGRDRCIRWMPRPADGGITGRRRVLKAGSIMLDDDHSVECTVKSLGVDGAGLVVSDAGALPADFVLAIHSEGFETPCRIIARDSQNLEVTFF